MYKPTKKYQLWIYRGHGEHTLEEYATLEECILAPKYGEDFIITQKVDWEVVEKKD